MCSEAELNIIDINFLTLIVYINNRLFLSRHRSAETLCWL